MGGCILMEMSFTWNILCSNVGYISREPLCTFSAHNLLHYFPVCHSSVERSQTKICKYVMKCVSGMCFYKGKINGRLKKNINNWKLIENRREERDVDEEWMDWNDELWEIRQKEGGTFDQMGPGLLCESSRCPQILQATEMPPAAKHQRTKESSNSALSHVHSYWYRNIG